MRVVCAATAAQLKGRTTDILLLPERVSRAKLDRAAEACPEAVVIGAIDDGRSITAYGYHKGREVIRYVKVWPEDPAYVSGRTTQRPLYRFRDVCIGVLICRDIDRGEFRANIVQAVKGSTATKKLICITADMSADWFPGLRIGPEFDGVHVLISNKRRWKGVNRCQSFFATPDRGEVKAVPAGQTLVADL